MKRFFSFNRNILDQAHRKFFISIFLMVGALISVLLASSYLLNAKYLDNSLSYVLILYAMMNLVLLFFNRLRSTNSEYILLLAGQFLILELSYALWFQIDNPIRMIWFSVPIALSLYIGSNLTVILTIFSSFISILYYLEFVESGNLNFVTITDSVSIIIILSLLMMFVRYRYHHDIEALHKLNDLMAQKELALLEMNDVLDGRIKEEISKHNEKEKMLLYQSRMAQMGELLSMIAHQWRQPLGTLSAINMQIDFMVKMDINSIETQEDKDRIIESLGKNISDVDIIIQNLSQTIEDFSDFYKPDKLSEFVGLNEVVEQAVGLVSSACKIDDIELIMDLQSTQSHKVYKNELIQVIVNFLNNARDQFKDNLVFKQQITIKTFDKEDKSFVEVYDNAGGIPEVYMEKIFEPYFSTKNEKNGTGLGLYMAKLLIEQHNNGTLSARNSGEGACFTITL